MTKSSFVRFHHPILCVTCQASPITVEKFQTRKQEARDVPFQLSDWWSSLLKPHHFSLARRRRRIIPHSSCCKGRKPTTTTTKQRTMKAIRFVLPLLLLNVEAFNPSRRWISRSSLLTTRQGTFLRILKCGENLSLPKQENPFLSRTQHNNL